MDDSHIDQAMQRNAVSATDCTGLIPFSPVSESEWESYQALYDFEADGAESDPLKDDGISHTKNDKNSFLTKLL